MEAYCKNRRFVPRKNPTQKSKSSSESDSLGILAHQVQETSRNQNKLVYNWQLAAEKMPGALGTVDSLDVGNLGVFFPKKTILGECEDQWQGTFEASKTGSSSGG